MQTLLDRMDRTSMYSGLEARVPFADHRIMEYVFNVPWSMKYQNGVKALLATPVQICFGRTAALQSPYPEDLPPGLRELLADHLRRIISDPNAPVYPLIDPKKAEAFLAAPKELGRPWFRSGHGGIQLMAYFIQPNDWWENIICPCRERNASRSVLIICAKQILQ